MSDKPQWRRPATAFAYLNLCEDATDVTGPARAVMWALAKHVDYRTGPRYMYLQDIMDRAGIRARQTCSRAIDELCERGLLTVEDGRKQPGQTKPAPRRYRLVLPEGYGDESNIAMSTRATYLGSGEQHSNKEQALQSREQVACSLGMEEGCSWYEFMEGQETCMTCGLERRIDNGTNPGGLVGRRGRHVDRGA